MSLCSVYWDLFTFPCVFPSYSCKTAMGILVFNAAVFGNLHGLFVSQELWLEHCVWLQYIFDFDVLLSGTDGCRDGRRPRKEKMGGTKAVMARWLGSACSRILGKSKAFKSLWCCLVDASGAVDVNVNKKVSDGFLCYVRDLSQDLSHLTHRQSFEDSKCCLNPGLHFIFSDGQSSSLCGWIWCRALTLSSRAIVAVFSRIIPIAVRVSASVGQESCFPGRMQTYNPEMLRVRLLKSFKTKSLSKIWPILPALQQGKEQKWEGVLGDGRCEWPWGTSAFQRIWKEVGGMISVPGWKEQCCGCTRKEQGYTSPVVLLRQSIVNCDISSYVKLVIQTKQMSWGTSLAATSWRYRKVLGWSCGSRGLKVPGEYTLHMIFSCIGYCTAPGEGRTGSTVMLMEEVVNKTWYWCR